MNPTMEQIRQQAQESGSTEILARLFGNWVYDVVGGSPESGMEIANATIVTGYGALMASAAVTLFGILMAYIAGVGLIKTATEGTFLGKQWSSPWVILRSLGSILMVAPVMGTGISAGQVLIVSAAMLASSMADIAWSTALQMSGGLRIEADADFEPTVNKSLSRDLIITAMQKGVCFYNHAKQNNIDINYTQESIKKEINKFTRVCGEIPSLENYSPLAPNEENQNLWEDIKGAVVFWADTESEAVTRHQSEAIAKAARSVNLKYFLLALKLAVEYDLHVNNSSLEDAHNGSFYKNKVAPLIEKHHVELKQSVTEAVRDKHREFVKVFAEESKTFGWVYAGSYYRHLSTQQTMIQRSLDDALVKAGQSVDPDKIDNLTSSSDMINYRVKEAQIEIDNGMRNSEEDESWWGDLFEGLGLNFLRSGRTSDPLLTMSTIGHTLSGAAVVGFGVKAVASKSPSGLFKGIVDKVTSSRDEGNNFISVVLGFMFIAGMLLGDVLPAIPWIIFLLSVVSWYVYVLEMFIASPFWFAAHAAPEGKDHTSNLSQKGYNNILFVIMFPILAIGGFLAGMAASWVGMYLVNQSISSVFFQDAGIGALLYGIGTLIVMIFLYIVLSWMVLSTSFNLISTFPRTILNWISVSDPGERPFEQKAERANTLIMGGVKNVGPTGMLANVRDSSLRRQVLDDLKYGVKPGGGGRQLK